MYLLRQKQNDRAKWLSSFECFRDCWYLYTLNPLDKYLSGRVDVEPDQTIEILMTDLNHKVMELFTKNRVKNGHEATKVSICTL